MMILLVDCLQWRPAIVIAGALTIPKLIVIRGVVIDRSLADECCRRPTPQALHHPAFRIHPLNRRIPIGVRRSYASSDYHDDCHDNSIRHRRAAASSRTTSPRPRLTAGARRRRHRCWWSSLLPPHPPMTIHHSGSHRCCRTDRRRLPPLSFCRRCRPSQSSLAAAAAALPPIPAQAPTERFPLAVRYPRPLQRLVYAVPVDGSCRTDDPLPRWCRCVNGTLSRATQILTRRSWRRCSSQRSTRSAPRSRARLRRHCHHRCRCHGCHGG